MRLMAGRVGGDEGIFLVDGDRAFNASSVDASLGRDLQSIVAGGDSALQRFSDAAAGAAPMALTEVTPALPLARPGKIICLGLNYADHAKEGGFEVPDYPALFMRGATTLVAAGAPVVRPQCSETLDYEAELMVIIGRGGRHIARADALDHVFGYSVFNDVSVRNYQRKTHQWTPGKNFDATGPFGPVVVTPDELPAGGENLHIEARLNGTVMQSATTSDMIFKVPETIEILSEFTTLEPGDLIAMGTPQGVGHARRPPVWMKPGDVIEIEIEGIGICANPIVAED